MSAGIQTRLRDFARSLLERRGALVEWPAEADEGWAMVPPGLARTLQAPELLRLSPQPLSGGLTVNLAADFLERTATLVEAEPSTGCFQIPELYLKRSAMDDPVARAFSWLNARVRVRGTRAARCAYHCWTFLAGLQSEDRWEDLILVSLNESSGAELPLPPPREISGLRPLAPASGSGTDTFQSAVRRACARIETRAEPFVTRLETRLFRDRKRLREYYGALLDEEETTGRMKDSDQLLREARRRAVELELRRKTSELEERYALRVTLDPLTLIRLEVPVLAVDCEVRRRQAERIHTLYWNPLLTALEPMGCTRCAAGTYAVAFTDAEVAPRCAACSQPD